MQEIRVPNDARFLVDLKKLEGQDQDQDQDHDQGQDQDQGHLWFFLDPGFSTRGKRRPGQLSTEQEAFEEDTEAGEENIARTEDTTLKYKRKESEPKPLMRTSGKWASNWDFTLTPMSLCPPYMMDKRTTVRCTKNNLENKEGRMFLNGLSQMAASMFKRGAKPRNKKYMTRAGK